MIALVLKLALALSDKFLDGNVVVRDRRELKLFHGLSLASGLICRDWNRRTLRLHALEAVQERALVEPQLRGCYRPYPIVLA